MPPVDTTKVGQRPYVSATGPDSIAPMPLNIELTVIRVTWKPYLVSQVGPSVGDFYYISHKFNWECVGILRNRRTKGGAPPSGA